jgi:hypothetical protein
MYGTLLAEKLTNAIQNANILTWPSVVVHEHWPASQRMIVEMGDYAWSEHIVTVFLACQITIKNVQVQLTVKGKTTRQLHPDTQKQLCPKCGCPEMKYRARIVQQFFYSKRPFRQFHGLRFRQT